jgi:hypothetical protein
VRRSTSMPDLDGIQAARPSTPKSLGTKGALKRRPVLYLGWYSTTGGSFRHSFIADARGRRPSCVPRATHAAQHPTTCGGGSSSIHELP